MFKGVFLVQRGEEIDLPPLAKDDVPDRHVDFDIAARHVFYDDGISHGGKHGGYEKAEGEHRLFAGKAHEIHLRWKLWRTYYFVTFIVKFYLLEPFKGKME